MNAKVLIIDDEDFFREDLAGLLRAEGLECYTAENGNVGLDMIEKVNPDVVLCDIAMPEKNGIEVLEETMARYPECFVIMITAYGELDTAVDAFRKGASDYVMKPFLPEDVVGRIERLVRYKRLAQELKYLRREASQVVESLSVVGQSEAMQKVLNLVAKVAPTSSVVLITGESGTGKEVVARAIHEARGGDAAPFVPINCAGIPGELLESELFGHERGAFTGAVKARIGHFELAGKGSILLDEIGDMPLALQTKLLRVLEEREFVRIGGAKPIPLGARIIVSTNMDLRKLMDSGKFRKDLFFRICMFEIHLPPLHERKSDIRALVESFVKKFNQELKRNCRGVNSIAMRNLLAHEWPGNVRELRNVVERAIILSQGEYITPMELPTEISCKGTSPIGQSYDNLRDAMRSYEREHIKKILALCGGNKKQTARRLEINPSTLYRKMEDLGFD